MAIAIGGNQINKAYIGTTEIQKMYLGSNLVFDNSVLALKPIMTNFRADETDKNRVYFDTPLGPVTDITTQGFTVFGKGVTAISDVDNYLTVDADFTFWDNTTIKLEGGDGTVYDFTKQYLNVKDYLTEPSTPNQTIWLAPSPEGSDSNDGLSEGSPKLTLKGACNALTQIGARINAKIGTYPSTEVYDINDITPSYTAASPLVIEGYEVTPGDITSNYYDYDTGALDDTQMPVFEGLGADAENTVLKFYNNKYVICRNLQSRDTTIGFFADEADFITFERCNSIDGGGGTSGTGIRISGSGDDNRVIDSRSVNQSTNGIVVYGSGNLVENSKIYCDRESPQQDYYLTILGWNNIFLNNWSERKIVGGTNWEHGFSISGSDIGQTEDNLVDGHTSIGMGKGMELRRHGCGNNVVRNFESYETSNGLEFRDGTFNNIVENANIHDVYGGFSWVSGSENGDKQGINNTIKNSIVRDATCIMRNDTPNGYIYGVEDNKFYNNTFLNAANFWLDDGTGNTTFSGNIAENNLIENVTNLGYATSGIAWDSNLFYTSFTAGTNQITGIDPLLDANYVPQADFDSIKRTRISTVLIDALRSERAADTTVGWKKNPNEEGGGTPPVNTAIAGWDGIGSSFTAVENLRASQVIPEFSGTAKSITFYHSYDNQTYDITLGIYADDGADKPSTLLGTTVLSKGGDLGWKTYDLVADVSVVAGTKYWIGFSGYPVDIASESGSGLRASASVIGLQSPLPDPFGTNSTDAFEYSLYFTYEY